jgi:hypothetical protein
MATDAATKNAAADGAGTLLESRWFAIHSANSSGTQTSSQRLQPAYSAASAGAAALTSTLSFTGAGSATAGWLGVWDASTAGSFLFAVATTGDAAFNAAGELNLTAAPVTVADA